MATHHTLTPHWPRRPIIYEINTWVWLHELSRQARRPMTLGAVPGDVWDALATYRRGGFVETGTWLGGGRAGPQVLMLRALMPVASASAMGESGHG